MRIAHRSTPAGQGPPNSINKLDKRPPTPTPTPPPRPRWPLWLLLGGVVLGAILLFHSGLTGSTTRDFSYSGFVSEVTANKVSTATISSTGLVTGKLANGVAYSSQIPTALNDNSLSPLLLKHRVQVTGASPSTYSVATLLFSLWPLLLLVGVFIWFARRGRKQIGGIMSFGRSKAKLYDEERPSTRFTDIAGYEGSKAEVMEVVDYLKHPQRYAQAGAVGPKGVLMVGPPGTGKTLLAKAVAGEAHVPFFALSGSSFVEMFVGVGASRVRDFFADARQHAPSIIFIDEIDAIGGRRGPGGFGSNDEREQTLNQLLSDMDGFEPGANVVVMERPTGPRSWTRPCCGPAASTGRWRSRCPTRRSGWRSWPSTGGAGDSGLTWISTWCPAGHRGSPALISPTW